MNLTSIVSSNTAIKGFEDEGLFIPATGIETIYQCGFNGSTDEGLYIAEIPDDLELIKLVARDDANNPNFRISLDVMDNSNYFVQYNNLLPLSEPHIYMPKGSKLQINQSGANLMLSIYLFFRKISLVTTMDIQKV